MRFWRKDKQAVWPVLGVAAVGVAALMAWALWPSASVPLANPDDPHQVALGQAVYRDHCARCHGADLEGEPDWQIGRPNGRMPAPPHDASGHTWHHADVQLFEVTKYGIERFATPGYQSDMPIFEDLLSDEEIWAVLAFIKSSWPERERAYQERITRAARETAR